MSFSARNSFDLFIASLKFPFLASFSMRINVSATVVFVPPRVDSNQTPPCMSMIAETFEADKNTKNNNNIRIYFICLFYNIHVFKTIIGCDERKRYPPPQFLYKLLILSVLYKEAITKNRG